MMFSVKLMTALGACVLLCSAPDAIANSKKRKPEKPKFSVRKETVYKKGVRQQELRIKLSGPGKYKVTGIHLYKISGANKGVYQLKKKEGKGSITTPYNDGENKLYASLVIVDGDGHFLKWSTNSLFLGIAEKLYKVPSGTLIDSKGNAVDDYQEKDAYQRKLLGEMGARKVKEIKREQLKTEVLEHNKEELDLSLAGLQNASTRIEIDHRKMKMQVDAKKLVGNTLLKPDSTGVSMDIVVYSKNSYLKFPKTVKCRGVFVIVDGKVWRTKRFSASYPADRPGSMMLSLKEVPDWGTEGTADVVILLTGKEPQQVLLRRANVKLEEAM